MIENVTLHAAERLLALEIRSRRIGFVVFDGPTRLLDWGVRSCSHPNRRLRSVVANKVGSLLFFYKPFAVVMRRENGFSSKTTVRLRISVGAIRSEANRCRVKLRLLKAQPRERFFVQLRCETKHQVAQLIAELFEELSWKVPPKRKPWHSESYNTVIFDAAATGLVAFAEEFDPDAVRELITTTESFRRLLGDVAR